MKEISIQGSEVHTWAKDVDIPLGQIRRFKQELHDFKLVWRQVFKPGQNLVNLARGGAGDQASSESEQQEAGGFIC